MNKCGTYTLGEVVAKYCLRLFNDSRKYFINYLSMASDVWENIYLRTLWIYQAEWLAVKKGSPYPYIKLPENIQYLIGIFYVDDCGKEIPLCVNNHYNVLAKPKSKQCGCKQNCNCGDGCTAVNSFTYTSKTVTFDNDVVDEAGSAVLASGTEFTEKTWIEKCSNGDLLRWREVPSEKYLDTPITIGEQEYSYQLEIVTESMKLCTIELKSCGCVEESDLNKRLIAEHCGCSVASCQTDLHTVEVNPDGPEIKFSSCGKMAYIINGTKTEYLCKYQANKGSANVLVPREDLNAIMTGIDYESKRFNPSVSASEKREAKYAHRESIYDLLEFHNPIDMEALNRIYDGERKW